MLDLRYFCKNPCTTTLLGVDWVHQRIDDHAGLTRWSVYTKQRLALGVVVVARARIALYYNARASLLALAWLLARDGHDSHYQQESRDEDDRNHPHQAIELFHCFTSWNKVMRGIALHPDLTCSVETGERSGPNGYLTSPRRRRDIYPVQMSRTSALRATSARNAPSMSSGQPATAVRRKTKSSGARRP